MKRWFIISVFCIFATLPAAYAQTRYSWKETTVQSATQPVNNPKTTGGIEVYAHSGTLTVRTPEKTTVTVLSILGQTISQTSINAGTYELLIGTHGIYIVKIGDFTLRVAL